jgi:type VI secretion system protein VasG
VILLDEMEKAHPGIQDVFYQVFDKGMIKDGQGRDIDFKNTMIIMTSNAGTDAIERLCADPETMPDAQGLGEALRPELLKVFKPAFLGRVTTVPFFPLPPDIIRQIVIINLKKIRERVMMNYRANFEWEEAVIDEVAKRCTESQSGARNIENILRGGMLPELATLFLTRLYEQKSVSSVKVTVDSAGNFSYLLE